MSLSDKRPTTKAQAVVLHRIMTPAQAEFYKRNRNDYAGYNEGRAAVDNALRTGSADLHDAIELLPALAYASERHVRSHYSPEVDHVAATEGFEALAARLDQLASRARVLAAVAAMRAEDDLADADLLKTP